MFSKSLVKCALCLDHILEFTNLACQAVNQVIALAGHLFFAGKLRPKVVDLMVPDVLRNAQNLHSLLGQQLVVLPVSP